MHNLAEISAGIIRQSIPELSRNKLRFCWYDQPYSYLSAQAHGDTDYVILSEDLRSAPANVVRGGLGHELAHLVVSHGIDNSDQGYYESRMYDQWPFYAAVDERLTDLFAIRRGLGQELLAFGLWYEENRFPITSDNGLTIDEIHRVLSGKTIDVFDVMQTTPVQLRLPFSRFSDTLLSRTRTGCSYLRLPADTRPLQMRAS